MENVAHETKKAISGAIKIDKKEIQDHIDGLVRQSVEDTLNALLNAEADAICNAGRYQRTPDRLDTRAGSCHRKLLTKAGEVDLKVPPASESALRNGDHPALSDQAELRGGGADRDVSGRRFCPAGGGHHGSAVGVRRSAPAPSVISIRRSTARSKSGECVRSTRSIPTCSWMAYI